VPILWIKTQPHTHRTNTTQTHTHTPMSAVTRLNRLVGHLRAARVPHTSANIAKNPTNVRTNSDKWSAIAVRMVNFWFGAKDSSTYGKSRKEWWVGTGWDQPLRVAYESVYRALCEGKGEYSQENIVKNGSISTLAAILILDQATRCMFCTRNEVVPGRNQEKATRTTEQRVHKTSSIFHATASITLRRPGRAEGIHKNAG